MTYDEWKTTEAPLDGDPPCESCGSTLACNCEPEGYAMDTTEAQKRIELLLQRDLGILAASTGAASEVRVSDVRAMLSASAANLVMILPELCAVKR